MRIRRRDVLKVLASSSAAATGLLEKEASAGGQDLERDVAIIGGGAAGTYAALRLRDLGKSAAIIERSGRLGGHAETFRDVSGVPIDIGVVIFPDNSLVRNYFGRFGQPLFTASFAGGTSQFVDFRTGRAVNAFNPGGAELGAALFQYLQIIATRFPFLELNGFHLPPPGPVLDELLLPFGEFAQKNGLNALLPTFFQFEQGFGPLLNATTLYVLKNMSTTVVSALLSSSFLIAPLGTGALYDAATAALSGDIVFDADLLSVDRSHDSRVRVAVRTPQGKRTIRAKKLLFTAPPVLPNLAGFDLDFAEFSTLTRFSPHHYWTAVAKIDGVPPGLSLVNAAPETPFNLAPSPGIYSIGPTPVPGLFNVKYGSSGPIFDVLVKLAIRADIERVRVPGVGPLDFKSFSIFKNHSPYSLVASAREIRAGFYTALQNLQGRNDTFYAGAAFQTHNSAAIWAHLEELLPTLFA